MAAQFQRYPSSSESIRALARKSGDSATAIAALRRDVDSGHKAALSEAAGDLNSAMGPMIGPFLANASEVARGAIWASCQLERFADAIDTYNTTSTEPRSISKLNAAYDGLDGDPLRRGERALIEEKGRLDGELDAAARTVARNLDRDPTDQQVLREWKAGNLPVAAIAAWPDLRLKLTELPFGATNTAISAAGLRNLSDERLADALADPDLNLSVRAAILDASPDAVAILAREWKLAHDTETRTDGLCRINSNGQIVGPDGRLYYVTIPGGPPESGVPVMRPMNDNILDDGAGSGWTTLGSRDGEIAYGKEIDWGDQVAFVLAGTAGTGKPIGEWQSIGEDQSQYIRTTDGSVTIVDGTEPPFEPTNEPTWGPLPERYWIDPLAGYDKKTSAAWLISSGLEGLNNAQQAENNRHYATEVVFQENADGELRAVINMYQVQSNGAEIRIQQGYGTVDPETGDIVPATPPDDD